ncbi:50S ribosomal protein L9 [Aureibacter tunicatorum]|uniref:Large ribosomal subunit protein bL9 n=1 Tax=Aureibacter tunicatorum TaxID=866807 RepID=A0AAE4BSS5_9BACT|nr:50S ribosomal protein L9 [Aureibacter tunicatorum]MDR6239128.1 large subunit ribosomal protein L9 [Aureibacter tunicatorum]BDD04946.1 50S ribosomal protein L9 [Aureibacter tunicatorum]
MEVILTQNIKGLGYKNDIVSVKPGYGRNYLIPQGFAILATASNKKMVEENIKQAAHKAEKIKTDAQELANKIGETKLTIPTKVGENGKIFGSITPLQLSEKLRELGFDIDRKQISLDSDAKFVGEYVATIDLHKEVKHEIKVEVVAE